MATNRGWLLFKGGIYFVGKPVDSIEGLIRYMGVIQLGLIDAGSTSHSLSILLSAVETSLRKRTALEIAQLLTGIISTHVRVLLILATATTCIRGWRLFHSELCGYYSRVASNRRNTVLIYVTAGFQTLTVL